MDCLYRMENLKTLLKWMIWGVPLFSETSISFSCLKDEMLQGLRHLAPQNCAESGYPFFLSFLTDFYWPAMARCSHAKMMFERV